MLETMFLLTLFVYTPSKSLQAVCNHRVNDTDYHVCMPLLETSRDACLEHGSKLANAGGDRWYYSCMPVAAGEPSFDDWDVPK